MNHHHDGRQSHHDDRVVSLLMEEAAIFIAREAGTRSMITVTRATLSSHGDHAHIFVSVFPDTELKAALSFLERQREEFSEHLKKHTRIKPLPRVDFLPDDGEKNRQRLDELSRGA